MTYAPSVQEIQVVKGRYHLEDYIEEVDPTDSGQFDELHEPTYIDYISSSRTSDEFDISQYLNLDFIDLAHAPVYESREAATEAANQLYDDYYFLDLLIPEHMLGNDHCRESSLINEWRFEISEKRSKSKTHRYSKFEPGRTSLEKYREMKSQPLEDYDTW